MGGTPETFPCSFWQLPVRFYSFSHKYIGFVYCVSLAVSPKQFNQLVAFLFSRETLLSAVSHQMSNYNCYQLFVDCSWCLSQPLHQWSLTVSACPSSSSGLWRIHPHVTWRNEASMEELNHPVCQLNTRDHRSPWVRSHLLDNHSLHMKHPVGWNAGFSLN